MRPLPQFFYQNFLVPFVNFWSSLKKEDRREELGDLSNLVGVHAIDLSRGLGAAFGLESSYALPGRRTKEANEVWSSIRLAFSNQRERLEVTYV